MYLTRVGSLTLKARPLTAEQVCTHAAQFWLGSQNAKRLGVDARDVQLYAIFLVGLNLGLRFDEVSKLKVEHITVNSRTVHLTRREAIKNSTEQRNYTIREWPEHTALRHPLYMDLVVAMLSWRGFVEAISDLCFVI